MFYVIQKFLGDTIGGLEKVDRWLPYVKAGSTPENDLQHSLSTVLLTILVLELLEQIPPNINYDPYEVLACAALHDLGEINVGDTIYKRKDLFSVRYEHESFMCQISSMPEKLRHRLHHLYMIQYQNNNHELTDHLEMTIDDTTKGSGIVFDFVERTGYLIYAIGEYNNSTNNIALLVQVLRNQIEHIKGLLNILPAGRLIFTDSLLQWMEDILKSNCNMHIEK